jgi:protein-disulfide isomerase
LSKATTVTVKRGVLVRAGLILAVGLAGVAAVFVWLATAPKAATLPDGLPVGRVASARTVAVSTRYGENTFVIAAGDPLLGDADAPLTLVEFSDFECPYCLRAHNGVLTALRESDYMRDGQVNLVFKHLPLRDIHPKAQLAAEAGECANRQGVFWRYHDRLFGEGTLAAADLKRHAANLGLDATEFDACLDDGAAETKVQDDVNQAERVAAGGTPYFILVDRDGGTHLFSGAIPWSRLEIAIKSMLDG